MTASAIIDLVARDKASKTFQTVGKNGEEAGKKMNRASAGMKVGLVAAAGAAVAFGKKSNDTFQRVGKETLKLQRSIGGTAEEASRLRFAAQETGTDIDTFTKGLGLLSKNLVGAKDKTKLVTTHVEVATGAWRKQTTIVKDAAGHFQKIEKMVPVTKMQSLTRAVKVTNPLVAQLGINIRDTAGHIRPMGDLLPEIAEKFKNMPNGAEKTALALKLFGRSGTDMLPFLNRGAEGIKDLEKQSDKLGNTLSGKDLQAVKDNTKAKREWHAAIQGVQIQLGRNLFPILTKGATILAKVAAFVERNGSVMKPLVSVVAGLVIGLKAWAIIQAVLNAELWANPIGIVVVALVALAAGLIYAYKHSEKFRTIVNTAFHAIAEAASWMWDKVLRPTFKFLADAWLTVAGVIIHSAASAFGWVPGIGPKLKTAAKEFDKFRDKVNASLDGVKNKTVHINVKLDGYANPQDLSIGHRYAAGGTTKRGLALVGEQGPEIVNFAGGEHVSTAAQTRAALRGGGGLTVIEVNFNGPTDSAAAARELRKLLNSQSNLGVA